MNDRHQEFLIGLERLTRDTGICVVGCGCCGSPALEDAEDLSPGCGYSANESGTCIEWTTPSSMRREDGNSTILKAEKEMQRKRVESARAIADLRNCVVEIERTVARLRDPQPQCPHPGACIVTTGEGTSYCAWCADIDRLRGATP